MIIYSKFIVFNVVFTDAFKILAVCVEGYLMVDCDKKAVLSLILSLFVKSYI